MLITENIYNNPFEQISFEVRFMVSPTGEILESNENGRRLIEENGQFIYNHFIPSYRHSFLQELKKLANGEEKVFLLKSNGTAKDYLFRGSASKDCYFLVGIESTTNQSGALKSFNFQGMLTETLSNALNIAVLILDSHNNVVFYNDVLKRGGRFHRDFTKIGGRPIIRVIKEMANDIRQSSHDVQRYHLYDKSLYHVYGLYNSHTEMITFIIDDRAGSEEYDSLLLHKQQMETVSHLAAGFAHELRNPLSVIRGFIQLSALTNDVDKYYKTILSELDRMNDIIDDFLSLSRKAPEKNSYNPYEFFQSIISLIRSECLLQNVKLIHNFEQTSRKILVNRSMIKQVFLNLLRNSIEAFEEGQSDKRFVLNGFISNGYYAVSIEDNGPGMEKSVLDQLGKPFFTTKEKGTGIGLPLCKKIIKEHDGAFEIRSELGVGTTIEILLPLL